VHGLDPAAGVVRVVLSPDELAAADVVVVLTPHAAFDLDAVVAHARYVFDTRCRVPAAANVEYL